LKNSNSLTPRSYHLESPSVQRPRTNENIYHLTNEEIIIKETSTNSNYRIYNYWGLSLLSLITITGVIYWYFYGS
jgi:hypothetical protein